MKPTLKRSDRKAFILSCIALAVSLYMILTGCTTGHKIGKIQQSNKQDAELHSLIESWYICKENPENNLPGEQRKARKTIYNHLKTTGK